MRLGKEYGDGRLEAACGRAPAVGAVGFKRIESMLKRGLDKQPLPQKSPENPPVAHDNIRGAEYYR